MKLKILGVLPPMPNFGGAAVRFRGRVMGQVMSLLYSRLKISPEPNILSRLFYNKQLIFFYIHVP